MGYGVWRQAEQPPTNFTSPFTLSLIKLIGSLVEKTIEGFGWVDWLELRKLPPLTHHRVIKRLKIFYGASKQANQPNEKKEEPHPSLHSKT